MSPGHRDRPLRNGSRPAPLRLAVLLQYPSEGLSLAFLILAVAALVIGGGFAEISSSGSPTSLLETAVIRWIILGSLVLFVVAYVVGGRRLQREQS